MLYEVITISPDETYLIFASGDLPDSFGSNDLYIGFKNLKGNWCDPINLGPLINGKKGEMCPMIVITSYSIHYTKLYEAFTKILVKKNRNDD